MNCVDREVPTCAVEPTCIRKHRIKRSPCIKQSVVKDSNLMSPNHCNLHLHEAVTPI